MNHYSFLDISIIYYHVKYGQTIHATLRWTPITIEMHDYCFKPNLK